LKMELKDKRITVVGLARSGVGAANLLVKLGASVTVTDMKKEAELMDAVKRLDPSVRRALGGHPEDVFMSSDMLVISPGVPLGIKPLAQARQKGVPVIGELELAYQIVTDIKLLGTGKGKKPSPPFLAVTGSNGKSTTTTLLDFMLRKGGFRTILGGNIGNALTEEIYRIVSDGDRNVSSLTPYASPDFIVVEVSSFQLEAVDTFRPRIASILNITPDHMDRYPSIDEYGGAKARICGNQNEDDFLVLNGDDPEIIKMRNEKLETRTSNPKVIYFSRQREVEGVYYKDGRLYCNIQHLPFPSSNFPFIAADEVRIKGVHNLENAMAASAMALLADCPVAAVIDSLREFGGLEHRLEMVRELDGVRYINDSKGTNVGAVIKSIESFDAPLILIAGGRDKAGDFSALRAPVAGRVKILVLIGEAAGKIKDALGGVTETVRAKDLREAVELSRQKAEKGDVVLLSPACASFDMFLDFEDRGRQFKKIVMELGPNGGRREGGRNA
jgi:UDP-N-acetylmuramoylalanine--D-glutamate ligase